MKLPGYKSTPGNFLPSTANRQPSFTKAMEGKASNLQRTPVYQNRTLKTKYCFHSWLISILLIVGTLFDAG